MLCHDGDGFGRIEGASTAEPDNTVMIARFESIDASVNDAICRVGDGLVEHAAFDIVLAECARYAVGIAVFHHKFVGDDQRPFNAVDLCENVGNMLNAATANLEKSWNTDSNCLSHSFPRSTLDAALQQLLLHAHPMLQH